MRNECNDYHYFFHFKRERCAILEDYRQKGAGGGFEIEAGMAARMLEDFDKVEVDRKRELASELRRRDAIQKELIAEQIRGKKNKQP